MKRLVWLVCSFLLALVACKKEVLPDDDSPQIPLPFVELMDAYRQGKVFDNAALRFGYSVVTFSDSSTIESDALELEISDCTSSNPLTVKEVNGYWQVGSKKMDIKVDKSLSDDKAYPVYVYFDDKTLHMHLCNGNVLSFWSLALEEDKKNQISEEELLRFQNLPVVRINTNGAPIVDKKNYVDGTITISDPEKLYSVISEYTADMGIRGRGNSTWTFPKKPWKVKLDKAVSILGMPADKEWALLANYTDRTLMRNVVAMKLSEMCGFSWTPRMCHVEVYLNDEYQGVYTFCEHKKVSKDRINLDLAEEGDNEGEDLTGDYYIEIEAALDEPVNWRTDMGVPLMFSDPDEPTAAQEAYIKQLFADFEASLHSEDLADPEKGYKAYIDVKSFIDYYIVQELTKNIDGNLFKSGFVTKQKGKKLEMYHLWDFDLTLGNCGYHHSSVGSGPDKFWILTVDSYSKPGENWFNLMMKDPAFVKRLKDRWNELKPSFDRIPTFIDQQAKILEKAQERNFEVWDINETITWVMMPSLGSYSAEVDYLRKFYKARLQWLDQEINRL